MRRLEVDQGALAELCRGHHIRRLSLFGSVLKGTDRPDSDIDLLVEFEPASHPTYFTLAQIELELSPPLGGRRIDLRTAREVKPLFPR